jgi:polysaccharide biosynthesis protein PslH
VTSANASTVVTSTPRAEPRRVLVLTPLPPRLDARHGLKATAQLLLRLAERNEIGLLTLVPSGQNGVDPAIAARCRCVEEVPLPNPGGAFSRRLVWSVGVLRGLPPWATDCRSAEYRTVLGRLLDVWRPHVVEVHTQAMAQYSDALRRKDVATILVDHDPGSAGVGDVARTMRGPLRLSRQIEAAVWRRYERVTRPRFDAIVVFSTRDAAVVAPTARPSSVVRIPLAVELPAQPMASRGSEPPTVLFVGAFTHAPNVDAAIRLAREIFPRVLKRVPEARLDLVGDQPTSDVRNLPGGAVSVHSSVRDVSPFLDRAAVVVAPIRVGGGARLKVLEAFAAGKALVASPRAVEGVDAAPGEHFLLATDDEEFVETVASLLRDPERRQELAESARAWAEHNLSWSARVEAFEALYDSLARRE